MSNENGELNKKMINTNSQLQKRKNKITKKVIETNNFKEEIKIMKKEQIQQKQKATSEKDNQTLIKTYRKLKQNWENITQQ